MKENKVPTLSIVLDKPEKKSLSKDDLDSTAGRTPNASLHKYVLHSTDTGQKVEIKDFPFTIGRALTSNLVIMDKNVSRNHATIVMDNEHVILENKGSLNGVRVNNHKVERAAIINGDEITIAGAKYTLQIERTSASVPVTKDDPQASHDAYNTKAASNDDLLDEQELPETTPDNLAQAEHLASKVGNKTLYALISITIIIAAATVVTLFQSSPDLSMAIKDVKEKPGSVTNNTPSGVNNDRYTGAIDNRQQSDNNDVSQAQNEYPRQASRIIDTQRANTHIVETTPAIQENQPTTQSTNPVDIAKAHGDGRIETSQQVPLVDPSAKQNSTQQQTEVAPAETIIAKRDIEVNEQKPLEIKPVETKQVEPPVVKAPVKYTRYSGRTSQIKLDNARGLYLGGSYHASIRELKSIYNSNRHRQQYRDKARTTKEQFSNLYALYSQGKSEYARNSKPKAFKTWASFLKKERSLLEGRTSQYSRNVKKTVALEYEEKGRQAYMRDDWRSAFRYWNSSQKMRPNASITNVLKQMEAEIASLYTKGSKLEKSNKSEAVRYWSEVVKKAPNNHEYYIKAKAKIRWLKSASQ